MHAIALSTYPHLVTPCAIALSRYTGCYDRTHQHLSPLPAPPSPQRRRDLHPLPRNPILAGDMRDLRPASSVLPARQRHFDVRLWRFQRRHKIRMMRRRPARRKHFVFQQTMKVRMREESVSIVAIATEEKPLPYWITHGISKVYGPSPAIVFEPLPPMASIRRVLERRFVLPEPAQPCASTFKVVRKAPSAKQRAAWDRWAIRQNGAYDEKDGYDHGECERQTRGVH